MALSRLVKVTGGLLLFVAQVSVQGQHQPSGAGSRTPAGATPGLAMAGDLERGRMARDVVGQSLAIAER